MGRQRPVATDMNRSLAKARDRTMGYLQIWYRLSTNVKDNIGHANVATMAKSQLMSMLQSCSYENILGQGQYKLNVRKADYKVL